MLIPFKKNRWALWGLIFPVLVSILACAHGGNGAFSPYETADDRNALIVFYQEHLNHLNAVRSGGCSMYPSCSEYSRQVMEKHGMAIGWIMTVDRLLRCGRDELKTVQHFYIDGKKRYYDPVEYNDFWHSPQKSLPKF